jgi:hypothetical protein
MWQVAAMVECEMAMVLMVRCWTHTFHIDVTSSDGPSSCIQESLIT